MHIKRLSRSPVCPHTEDDQTSDMTETPERHVSPLRRPESSQPAAASLSCHRLIFQQLGKSVMWNNGLSTVTASDLFPKALWAHWRYSNGPLSSSRARLQHSPKVFKEENVITSRSLIIKLKITVNIAPLKVKCQKTPKKPHSDSAVCVISSHNLWLTST